MGLFKRLWQYFQKVYYKSRGQLDRFQARAYFWDGGSAVYAGPPVGPAYEQWKNLVQ